MPEQPGNNRQSQQGDNDPDLTETAATAVMADDWDTSELLIVEDDATTRTMLEAITRKWGYRPVAVTNGDEAWRIMQRPNHPHLLLLDWMMPGMDGLTLCRRIRAQRNGNLPFIILLTARNETRDIISGLDAGANEYIAKPFNNAELRARLDVGRRMLRLQLQQIDNERHLRLAASVFTHAKEGITIADANGLIVDVNDAFCEITGYTRQEVIGKNPKILKSGRQGPEFYRAMWHDLKTKGHWYGEIWNRRKNGEVYAEMLTITAVRDHNGQVQHYIALFSDITVQKEHQRQLEHIAHYDALTGLPNRVLLADRLHQAMAQTKRHDRKLAVVYLDLDGFKEINDHYGHDIGDRLLMTLPPRMKEALREEDTIARLGGDEFIAVLGEIDDEHMCSTFLQRLLDAVSKPIWIDGIRFQISASLGVTFYPQDDRVDADQLLRQADQAMYQAKLMGKNRYHLFDAAHDRSVRGRHEEIEHIRHALTNDEFTLHYQPKVNMRSGQVIGAEALIRWRHPERGLLPPDVFLPVIEDHPLALELGEWVIDTALRQMQQWQTTGLMLPLSVNISAYQLQQPGLPEQIRQLLARYPTIAPENLTLEILETSALEDITQSSTIMEECTRLGVRFSLDDFGTGYSSLSYLKRLPINQLKIDRSFVRDMLDDPDDFAILEGVMGLASAFHLEVIAEGVETSAHGRMLLQLGCQLAQGFAIARPMPAERLEQWIGQWQPFPDWRDQPILNHAERQRLSAMIEHRTWLRRLREWKEGQRTLRPALDSHTCRLGRWLNSIPESERRSSLLIQAIDALHQQLHDIAANLLSDAKQSQDDTGAMQELQHLHRLLASRLEELSQSPPPSPGRDD